MKVIAVTSGKGGVGKSCVTAYTGLALAASGGNTLLIEPARRSLDIITNTKASSACDLGDALLGKCQPAEAVSPAGIGSNLFLLPGAPECGDPGGMKAVLTKLKGEYAHILLDDFPLEQMEPGSLDVVLMVTTPDTLSIRACVKRTAQLYGLGYENIRLVINNVPVQVLPMDGAEDFDDVIDMIGARLLGVIPASPKLQYSSNNGKPVSGDSLAPEIYDCIAARLKGEDKQLLIR